MPFPSCHARAAACAKPRRALLPAPLLAPLLAVLLSLQPAHADPGPLSVERAQRLALQRSRQLPAQQANADAARAMAQAARRLPDPVLRFGVDNLPVSGADRWSFTRESMTMQRVGLMQELTRLEKRELRAGRFENAAHKAGAEKNLAAAAISRDTALAWLDLHYANEMAQVVAQQGAQARAELVAAEGGYRGGRASAADVLAARSAVALALDRASEAGRKVANARTMLARWVGPDVELALAGLPNLEKTGLEQAGQGDGTLAAGLAHHPEIAVLDRQADIARSEAALAHANKKPDWSVEVTFQKRADAYSNMVSVGLSVPLQWDRARRQDRELGAALALADAAGAERDEALRAHEAQVRALLGDWQALRERQQRYRSEIVPLAGDSAGAVLAAYRGGKASLAELLAARRNETDTRLEALQLDLETARAWAQLSFFFPAGADRASGQTIDTGDAK